MWTRITLINAVFRFNSMLTLFFVGQLQPSESQQVREVLIQLLDNDQETSSSYRLKSAEKMYEHSGVNCRIITEESLELAKSKLWLFFSGKVFFLQIGSGFTKLKYAKYPPHHQQRIYTHPKTAA